MSDIHFILTGGTIDSEYNPPTETSEPLQESVIPPFLSEAVNPYQEYSFETICMLDSGDITDKIRSEICTAIQNSDVDKLIICHGTNTMTETATYLNEKLKPLDKTVILTGAMIPLKQFVMSDGGFNLGYAIAEVNHLPSGVYICMHGKTFNAGAVTKNRAIARFEEL